MSTIVNPDYDVHAHQTVTDSKLFEKSDNPDAEAERQARIDQLNKELADLGIVSAVKEQEQGAAANPADKLNQDTALLDKELLDDRLDHAAIVRLFLFAIAIHMANQLRQQGVTFDNKVFDPSAFAAEPQEQPATETFYNSPRANGHNFSERNAARFGRQGASHYNRTLFEEVQQTFKQPSTNQGSGFASGETPQAKPNFKPYRSPTAEVPANERVYSKARSPGAAEKAGAARANEVYRTELLKTGWNGGPTTPEQRLTAHRATIKALHTDVNADPVAAEAVRVYNAGVDKERVYADQQARKADQQAKEKQEAQAAPQEAGPAETTTANAAPSSPAETPPASGPAHQAESAPAAAASEPAPQPEQAPAPTSAPAPASDTSSSAPPTS